MRRTAHTAVATALLLITTFCLAQPASAAGNYALASRNSSGTGSGSYPAISDDGRYVAFTTSSKLLPADTNTKADVYRKDLTTGAVVLASSTSSGVVGDASSGQGAANYGDAAVDMSSDGRYISFPSLATNFDSTDTNGKSDVYRKDLSTGSLVLVSRASAPGNDSSGNYGQSISDDGNLVAFASASSNLVANDTNGASDVFLRNISSGTTTRLSVSAAGGQGNAVSDSPRISGDGTQVAFVSLANNLTSGVGPSGSYNIYVRATASSTVVRVTNSVASGSPSIGSGLGISKTGAYVVFSTRESFVTADTDTTLDVYVRTLATGATQLASSTASGGQTNESLPEGASNYDIDSTGTLATFASSTKLTTDDTNTAMDVYQKNLSTGAVVRVSSGTTGTSSSGYYGIAASASGSFVAFDTYNSYVSADTGGEDVYRWS